MSLLNLIDMVMELVDALMHWRITVCLLVGLGLGICAAWYLPETWGWVVALVFALGGFFAGCLWERRAG